MAITSTSERTIKVHLILDEEEAHLLMGLVQNPLFEDETEKENKFRESLFNTLQKQGIKP